MQDYINININHTLLQYYILSNIQNDIVIQIYVVIVTCDQSTLHCPPNIPLPPDTGNHPMLGLSTQCVTITYSNTYYTQT